MANERFSPILDTACQTSRTSQAYPERHQQIIWDTATTVIGPLLFAFVWWTLQKAKQQNIRRLYFLARDGQILLQIAQLIKEKGLSDLECSYLYGSRQAWLIPAIQTLDQAQLKWIFSDWWYVLTINSVCKRLGITPEEIKPILEKYHFANLSFSAPLSFSAKSRLKTCLQSNDFQKWFLARTKQGFDNTFGYFKQEGLLDNVPYGLVDIGWKGNQQISLNKILAKGGHLPKTPIQGFYLGITELSKNIAVDQFHGFLFDLSKSLTNFRLCNNHLYEAFTASTEGRVIGFKSEQGRFLPITEKSQNAEVLRWGLKTQQQGILHFCKEFLGACPAELLTTENFIHSLRKILYRFIENPTPAEAEVHGQFPMDGEMTESNIQEVAPKVSRRKFWQLCSDLKRFNLFWVQASLIRSALKAERWLWKILLPVLTGGYFLIKILLRGI